MSVTDETNGLYPGATRSFHKSTRKGKDKQTTARWEQRVGQATPRRFTIGRPMSTWRNISPCNFKRPGQICEGTKYENDEEYLQNGREKTLPGVTVSNISYKLAMCKPFDPMTLCAGIYSKDTLSYCDIHRALGRQCTQGWTQALSAPVAPGAFKFHGPELLLGSSWAHIPIHHTKAPTCPFPTSQENSINFEKAVYSSTPDSGWLEPSPSGLSSLPGSHWSRCGHKLLTWALMTYHRNSVEVPGQMFFSL